MSDDTTDTHVDNAEPSMEDILASIRRIIADEDDNAASNESIAAQEAAVIAEDYAVIEASDQASSDKELEMVDLQDNSNILSLVEEHDPSAKEDVSADIDTLLSDLDDSSAMDASDVSLSEIANDQNVKASTGNEKKLTGLGAIAAASLGAVASAGTATAKSVTVLRNNPSPQSTLDALGNDTVAESLDLLIDKDENHTVSQTVDAGSLELDEFLQIPDSDTPETVDEIDALLGNLFDDKDKSSEPDLDVNALALPAEDVIEGDGISDELLAGLLNDEELGDIEMPVPAQSTDELDLVKSLMADLTADPLDGAEEGPAEEGPQEAELVDDILSLSMEDEVALESEADSQSTPTLASNAFVIDIHDDLSGGSDVDDIVASLGDEPQPSSLTDIAQEAEADAKRIERGQGFAAAGFAASAGMAVATAGPAAAMVGGGSTKTDSLESTQEVDDILAALDSPSIDQPVDEEAVEADDASQIELETPTSEETLPPQETADMPKAAAKKDAIINEVTEEATAGAFASLNQIVENNADVQERGDRIGDLVQEALRPMLKEWLDKNLKGIVERAVTKEVKRISSGK